MKQRYYGQHARALGHELEESLSKDTIRMLHKKNPWKHGALAARQFALLGACIYGTVVLEPVWAWLPLTLLLGLTLFNFTVMLHEVLHHCVFNDSKPKAEKWLAQLYALPSGISPTQFTRWHLDHHAELGSMDDPKRHHLSPKKNKRWLKLLYATPALFFIYFRASAKETSTYEPEVQRRISLERMLAMGTHVLAACALGFLFGGSVLLKSYVIPVFFVFPIAFALNRLGQHYAIEPNDPAQWSTLMRSNRFWNWIFLYSNLHLEHHYYPGVPCYRLPELQHHLREFYRKKGMRYMGYGKLIRGWIFENQSPHSHWH